MTKTARAVVVMRAQPPHLTHGWLIREALKTADQVLICIGSAHQARTPRNPFTAEERIEMIELMLTPEERSRINFGSIPDFHDNDRWVKAVRALAETPDLQTGAGIAIVGHHKDTTSEYLDLFPGWSSLNVERATPFDSTTIRKAIYASDDRHIALRAVRSMMDPKVFEYVAAHLCHPFWDGLAARWRRFQAEAALWGAPPKNFVRGVLCGDALIEWNDEVLLFRREDGLLCIPGGHVEHNETTYQAAIRELKEETGIGLLSADLQHSLVNTVFRDAPGRSERPGRVVSMVHHFRIKGSRRPAIGGPNEEGEPVWMPKQALHRLRVRFFEDHYLILEHLLGLPE